MSRGKTNTKTLWGLSSESFGLLLMVGSAAIFSLTGVFIQLAVSTGLPSTELVFLRAIFQGSLILTAMAFFHNEHDDHHHQTHTSTSSHRSTMIHQPYGPSKVQKIVLARGMVGGVGFLCYFYAISVLPLGDAMTLLSLHPIVTVFAAGAFLGEPIRTSHVLAAVASVIGAVCIAQPVFLFGSELGQVHTTKTIHGYIAALVGTCTGSGVICLMRKAGTSGAHTLQLMFSWATFGSTFSFLVGMFGTQVPWHLPSSTTAWGYVFGVCALGSMAHVLFNHAGRIAPAGLSSIARSSEIMWSYVWQVLVLAQVPKVVTVIGVVLICLSIMVVAAQNVSDERNSSNSGSSNNNNNKEDGLVKVKMQNETNEEEGLLVLSVDYGSTK